MLKKCEVIYNITKLNFHIHDISHKHLNLGYFEGYITGICVEDNVDKILSTKCARVTAH